MLSRILRTATVAALALGVTVAAFAADASGKWTWTQRRQQAEVQVVLEAKQAGEKLTGTVTAGQDGQKTEIKEGTVKGSDITFVVIRERNGQQFKTVYKGKIDGDTITGTSAITINGEERNREWKATRAK
ncbi:MAG: hypothetical protein FJX77_11815 [Armatimonadetes bacterium]|nr:hypothetical protein [Armatimonadota bacterium]